MIDEKRLLQNHSDAPEVEGVAITISEKAEFMIDARKRLAKDRYFMLSVYGLGLMVTPLVLIVVIENLLLLIQPNGANVLVNDLAWTLRRICRAVFDYQPFTIGVGMVLPMIGAGMVAVAWFLMLRRFFFHRAARESSMSR